MFSEVIMNTVYLISALLFILGIKQLGSPATARQGNGLSAIGMFIAIVATVLQYQIIDLQWVGFGLVVGSLIGIVAAKRVAMTAMPQMVALLNGFGGASSLLLAWGAYVQFFHFPINDLIITHISVFIGGITFTGSLVAWAKLAEKISSKPLQFWGQQFMNIVCVLAIVACAILMVVNPVNATVYFYGIIGISLMLGLISVLAIGGGDMPVVIALLNSFSGLAACAAGFVVSNLLLIVAGLLVGASGLILTIIMCKAMNRTLTNVLFSGFGQTRSQKSDTEQGDVNPISAEDAYYILEAARSVVIVPGYGMAVAQAQHAIRECAELLEKNGCDVKFAIHPVAGRMPGHMNVLLAEANVPYDQCAEMDDVNPTLETVDVCLVIGANDVVNPDALEDSGSPIYGMPIIEVYKAKTVFVLKRSMNPGFAGVQNPLFFKENTRMLFGDAKASIQNIVTELKE
ncbi:NAD synthetase [Candidatus Marinamargulisbacteria bacterium SCGC AG-414-C22]|nr:NAD synthetase [Candidatus Marinamargulisbacteria bacterium SCGC AG-414-C22]